MSDLIAAAMAATEFNFADATANPPVEAPVEGTVVEQPEETVQEPPAAPDADEVTEPETVAGDEDGAEDAEEQTNQDAGDPLDLADDTIVVVDGKPVRHGDAFVPKAEFTRKTQEAAAKVAAAEELKAQAEDIIAKGDAFFAKPVQASMEALTSMADATGQPIENVVYRLIYNLNQGGAFTDPAFLETFKLDRPENPINLVGKTGEETDKVAELEAQLEAERAQRVQADEQAQLVAAYEASAASIAVTNGLRFTSVEEKDAWMGELFKFALEHDLLSDASGKPDLSAAYQRLSATKPAPAPAAPAVSPERAAAARKVSTKSTAAAAAPATAPAKTNTWESAMAASLAELKGAGQF